MPKGHSATDQVTASRGSGKRLTLKRPLLLALVVIAIFCPGFVTLGWHVFHGGTIQYEHRGQHREILVPLFWYGHADIYSATANKVGSNAYSWLFSKPSHFSVSPLSTLPAFSYREGFNSFEKGFWSIIASEDDVVTGPIRVGSGESDGVCMQAISKRQHPGIAHLSCLLYQGTWGADFLGDEKDVNTFLGAMRTFK
jgi:hypothetical protein